MDVDEWVECAPRGGAGTTAGPRMDTVQALLHDLRGPLAAIQLLAATPVKDVAVRMNAIDAQARWMSTLVDSTLKAGANEGIAPVDVLEIVTEACDLARDSAPTEIVVRAQARPTNGWARPTSLRRALGCLLDNAVRAAGPEGHVAVVVAHDHGDLTIAVIDDGPGPGRIEPRTSLGLPTTRAMVADCHGSFRLRAGAGGGAVAEICLDAAPTTSVP